MVIFLFIKISQICVQVVQAVILEYAVRQLSRDVEKYSESPPLSNNYSAMGITWEGVWPSGCLSVLRSGYPGLKTPSDHWLNLFLVVPGSTSQLLRTVL